jgi:hypothetical protein
VSPTNSGKDKKSLSDKKTKKREERNERGNPVIILALFSIETPFIILCTG